MEFFVIGVYRNHSVFTGLRLLAYTENPDEQNEVKDINYNAVYRAIKENKISVSNIKITKTGLSGVNGALTRYGTVGVSRSLVILREIIDNLGKTLGYVCADTSGEVRNLKVNEVIDFADKFGIANGRIMTSEKGVKTVATIDGQYKKINVRRLMIDKAESKPVENKVENKPTVNKVENKVENKNAVNKPVENSQGNQNIDISSLSMYDKALLMDKELNKDASYASSFANEVAKSVKKYKKCSEKQYVSIWKKLNEVNPELAKKFKIDVKDYFDDYSKLIVEAKTFSEFKGSHAEDISKTVESKQTCSDRQYYAIKKQVDEWKSAHKNDNDSVQAEPESIKAEPEPIKAEPEPIKAEPEPIKAEPEPIKAEPEPIKAEPEPIKAEPEPSETVENNEVQEEQEKPKVHYDMTQADNFEYIMVGDTGAKKLYIKGLKEGVDVDILVLPETLNVKGKDIPIQGIYSNGFRDKSSLTYVETGKYIEDIGQGAFANCKNLQTVDLSKSQHKFLARDLFEFCSNLTNVSVGNCIERIHEGAFYRCKKLETIKLPLSLRDIAREAFYQCTSLKAVIGGKDLNIQESAFNGCYELSNLDFNTIQGIGAQAFRDTGFTELKIPGHIKVIGRKAFADCVPLKEVWLEDGVSSIGDYCFAKDKIETINNTRRYVLDKERYVDIEKIHTTKSIIKFGDNVFKGAQCVEGYTGSATESHCRGYQIPFVALDRVDKQNSSNARYKSQLFNANVNIIETLHNKLNEPVDNASNPSFEMKQKGLMGELVDIELSDSHIETLKVGKAEQSVEPHIKFKAAVNYLLDISKMYVEPFHSGVLRLQQTFYIKSKAIYDDGSNKIYRIKYTIMDTLEKGEFIVVLTNNHLRFCVDCNEKTAIEMSKNNICDMQLPFKQYLHEGDALGHVSTICGKEAIYETETGRTIRVGEEVYKAIEENSVQLEITQETRIYYVPACNMVFKIVDRRKWDKSSYGKILKSGMVDQVIIQDIWEYNQFITEMQGMSKKVTNENTRFFKNIMELTQKEVDKRIRNIGIVEEEKQAQLYSVSKALNNIAGSKGISVTDITPDIVTKDIFFGIAESYWMIEKDQRWFNSIGKKSLNVTNQYMIENLKLIEYKSNQVVKFSNPYMSGMKGAYIYTLEQNGTIIGAYASKYSFSKIVSMLSELTYIPSKITEIPTLMTKADEIDRVDRELFCDFYNVLDCKDGWELRKYFYSGDGLSSWARFYISMYKPTGIFYLVMQRLVKKKMYGRDPDGSQSVQRVEYALMTMPIVPIGNMDRALVVAQTTNTGAKDSRALKELIELCVYETSKEQQKKIRNEEMETDPTTYYKVRQLIIDGETNANEYKKLIDDRIVYMLGTVHKGALRAEGDNLRNYDEIDEEYLSEDESGDEDEYIGINDLEDEEMYDELFGDEDE